MKCLFLCILLLGLTEAARAEQVTCTLSEIMKEVPVPENSDTETVTRAAPAALKTTDGLFVGTVFYKQDEQGYWIVLRHGEVAATAFFDGSPKSPAASLYVDGMHAQISCIIKEELRERVL